MVLGLGLPGGAPAFADVEGVVATAGGQPIAGAVVVDAASGAQAVTDARGHFRLRGVDPPVSVHIVDPRFETLVATISDGAGTPPVLTLTPKQQVYEKVIVTARPGTEVVAPLSSSATAVERDELAAPAGTVVDMATSAAGVAEAGQGGRFQAYSVRGVAGQRVFTTVSGMRIVTERRAGSTASFVDPSLLESIEVVRGPGSTLYGSGALGGVVQALPRRLDGLEAEAGYGTQGDEKSLFTGRGGEGWTTAIAGRDAGDGEDGDGNFLFNHSTQWSGLLRKEWERPSGTSFEVVAIPARARDIAKPNTRYPGRITRYPAEDHLLLRFNARLAGGWRLGTFIHPNDLETDNLTATSRSLVRNEAFDWGLDAQRDVALGGAWTALAGFDYFGRDAVTATEDVEDLSTGAVTHTRTLDGREGQASLFGTVRSPIGRLTFEAGARFTRIEQTNEGSSSDDGAGAGFLGVTVPLGAGFELAANAGGGLRFPSLSERFFTGSTGAGGIVANDDLEPERSLSGDLGLRYFGTRLFVEVFGFRNEIEKYIEQIEVLPGVDTFVNLTRGTIDGFDLDGWYAIGKGFKLTWSASRIKGESDSGAPLADIPSDRVALGAHVLRGRWRAGGRIEHRFDKTDPGPGEVETDGTQLVSASFSCDLPQGLRLRIHATNLLDRAYLPSADDLAAPGPGRSMGLSVAWAHR
ncbi:MAG TPA: TonB-dependent receptor [Candidatus Polarisedimenticolia bacterium]|jgi:iron complex outermembrane receptor protein|nr:TonB-dependent receptor [Candidatus Polarisedimenticolia bacterium]